MYLILDNRGCIVAMHRDLPVIDEGTITVGDSTYYGDFDVQYVESVPLHVKPDKYYYIDGEFIRDPQLDEVEQQIAEVQAQLSQADGAVIELYEGQLAIQSQTDAAIIELYELTEGGV